MAEPMEARRRGPQLSPTVVLGAILVAALVIFVLQNTSKVTVTWLFFDAESRLWFVILATIVITLLAERLVLFGVRKRRERSSSRPG